MVKRGKNIILARLAAALLAAGLLMTGCAGGGNGNDGAGGAGQNGVAESAISETMVALDADDDGKDQSGDTAEGENGSGASDGTSADGGRSEDSKKFEAYMRRLFVDTVSSDTLSLHYSLKDPAAYGITMDEVTFGDPEVDMTAADYEKEIKEVLNQLESFDYNALTDSQKLTYDVIKEDRELQLMYNRDELRFYSEPFSAQSGLQNNLPVDLAEYAFDSEQDVKDYLELLADLPRYMDEILRYEEMKSEAGLFMSDQRVDEVTKACRTFIEDPKENLLIEVFEEKIDQVEDLTKEQKEAYTADNEEAVNQYVIPTYEKIIETFEGLKGTGTNEGGICHFPDGGTYFGYLVKKKTGTEMTASQLYDDIGLEMVNLYSEFYQLMQDHPDILDEFTEYQFDESDPKTMIAMLQGAITENFPDMITDQYSLKYVPKALEESMNPAFYMIPPVDDLNDNKIYLNQSQMIDNMEVFTTLAHEGYPGHLYQMTFFSSTDPDPIRFQMTTLGYVEGWATYAEDTAYKYMGMEDYLARFMALNREMTLCLYAQADIGVNSKGWTKEDLKEYLDVWGMGDDEVVDSMYGIVIGEPASYLPYCVGNIQLRRLRSTLEDEMGNAFDEKAFHQAVMETGPCSFRLLEREVRKKLGV